MTTEKPHINTFRSSCSILALLSAALAVSVGATDAAMPVPATVTPRVSAPRLISGSYRWPVKPFDRPHPVRGNFGDPRTTFRAPATTRGLMSGSGVFAFHFGVDISAPDGTPVYPVRSGVARLCGARNVHVDSPGRFAAEYWHIVPVVRPGQRVVAYTTILGHVQKGYEHVHFSELRRGFFVNPLAPGHLGPYRDSTSPSVDELVFRTEDGTRLDADEVHGTVELLASASDRQNEPVPGDWAGMPVSPAIVTWHLERADGTPLEPERVAFDVRARLPRNVDFWRYYARGSQQNIPNFEGRRMWHRAGVYLYELARAPLDTTRLADGVYRLVVTAGDAAGHRASSGQDFTVRNEAA
jgi:murein DD-endopeptidase MepM/ murein hydrolase activator NlpD